MALDAATIDFPKQALLIRGARSPNNEGLFDGWREDLGIAGVSDVMAPGGDYLPHVDHREMVEAVRAALEEATAPQLILAHSYGGNVIYKVLRANPGLAERVSTIVHMASPLKYQMGIFPEPSPDLKVPVIGFRGLNDSTVPRMLSGSRIDTALHDLDCGHNDFVSNPKVRALVLEVLQTELVAAEIVA